MGNTSGTPQNKIAALLSAWRADPSVSLNVAAWRTLPARPARFAPFPEGLHPALAGALRRLGIRALYAHQAAAWGHAQAGRHPVIVTGTASGKTLCYNLPVLQALLCDPDARALYIFPTKALAQDQKDQVEKLIATLPVSTYDGDTPTAARPAIRTRARLIITNPDMLHTGVLPHHTAWADFFRGLRFVVIDEMHAYRGVFGSHVANVLRRLKRVARFYGAAPQFILTSATLANPAELAGRLIEEPVAPVDDDGSAKGEKHLLIYNPPVVNRDLGLRRSALLESVRLAQDLLRHDVQTIVFGRARRAVELMLTYLRRNDEVRSANDELKNHKTENSNFELRNWGREAARRSGLTAAATSPASAARSRPACVTGASAPSWPPTPSSWASTWAAWARPC